MSQHDKGGTLATRRLHARMAVCGLALTASIAAISLAIAASAATASSGTLTITSDTKLTEDHVGNIVVAADNVSLDCAGHSVTGPGSGFGIYSERSGVSISRCSVSGFELGIFLVASSNSAVTGNTAFDNTNQGIALNTTDHSRVAGNTVYRNVTTGIGLAESHGTRSWETGPSTTSGLESTCSSRTGTSSRATRRSTTTTSGSC